MFRHVDDAAGNLAYRTNNALVQNFSVNSLNQLTSAGRSGTLTVAGTTTTNVTSVTVNSQTAERYSDATFPKVGRAAPRAPQPVTDIPLFQSVTGNRLENLFFRSGDAVGARGATRPTGNNAFTATASDILGRSSSHSITVNLPASPTYTHDSNGNMTSDSTRGYEYDDENQLVRITQTNSWKSEFTYDGKMRRRIRKEFEWVNSAWVLAGEVRYVYDGNLVVQERDLNNVPGVTYTRGKDLSGSLEGAGGIGGLLARTTHHSPLTTHFYHADSNGNITALTDAAQGIAAKYTYDPFGNILSKTGPLADANLHRFSSKEFHEKSGLVYYLYRYYEPNSQRWLNRDPLGDLGFVMRFELVNVDKENRSLLPFAQSYAIIEEWEGANLYGFVYNNPVMWVDAYGLYTFGECMDICGAFFSGAAQGLGAVADGALPFVDPFAGAGAYDPNDPTFQRSQTCGAIASCAAGGAGALRGAAALGGTRAGHILNHNRYIRIGPGNIPRGKPFTCGPGQNVPTLRIGNGPPRRWNHYDLRAWGH